MRISKISPFLLLSALVILVAGYQPRAVAFYIIPYNIPWYRHVLLHPYPIMRETKRLTGTSSMATSTPLTEEDRMMKNSAFAKRRGPRSSMRDRGSGIESTKMSSKILKGSRKWPLTSSVYGRDAGDAKSRRVVGVASRMLTSPRLLTERLLRSSPWKQRARVLDGPRNKGHLHVSSMLGGAGNITSKTLKEGKTSPSGEITDARFYPTLTFSKAYGSKPRLGPASFAKTSLMNNLPARNHLSKVVQLAKPRVVLQVTDPTSGKFTKAYRSKPRLGAVRSIGLPPWNGVARLVQITKPQSMPSANKVYRSQRADLREAYRPPPMLHNSAYRFSKTKSRTSKHSTVTNVLTVHSPASRHPSRAEILGKDYRTLLKHVGLAPSAKARQTLEVYPSQRGLILESRAKPVNARNAKRSLEKTRPSTRRRRNANTNPKSNTENNRTKGEKVLFNPELSVEKVEALAKDKSKSTDTENKNRFNDQVHISDNQSVTKPAALDHQDVANDSPFKGQIFESLDVLSGNSSGDKLSKAFLLSTSSENLSPEKKDASINDHMKGEKAWGNDHVLQSPFLDTDSVGIRAEGKKEENKEKTEYLSHHGSRLQRRSVGDDDNMERAEIVKSFWHEPVELDSTENDNFNPFSQITPSTHSSGGRFGAKWLKPGSSRLGSSVPVSGFFHNPVTTDRLERTDPGMIGDDPMSHQEYGKSFLPDDGMSLRVNDKYMTSDKPTSKEGNSNDLLTDDRISQQGYNKDFLLHNHVGHQDYNHDFLLDGLKNQYYNKDFPSDNPVSHQDYSKDFPPVMDYSQPGVGPFFWVEKIPPSAKPSLMADSSAHEDLDSNIFHQSNLDYLEGDDNADLDNNNGGQEGDDYSKQMMSSKGHQDATTRMAKLASLGKEGLDISSSLTGVGQHYDDAVSDHSDDAEDLPKIRPEAVQAFDPSVSVGQYRHVPEQISFFPLSDSGPDYSPYSPESRPFSRSFQEVTDDAFSDVDPTPPHPPFHQFSPSSPSTQITGGRMEAIPFGSTAPSVHMSGGRSGAAWFKPPPGYSFAASEASIVEDTEYGNRYIQYRSFGVVPTATADTNSLFGVPCNEEDKSTEPTDQQMADNRENFLPAEAYLQRSAIVSQRGDRHGSNGLIRKARSGFKRSTQKNSPEEFKTHMNKGAESTFAKDGPTRNEKRDIDYYQFDGALPLLGVKRRNDEDARPFKRLNQWPTVGKELDSSDDQTYGPLWGKRSVEQSDADSLSWEPVSVARTGSSPYKGDRNLRVAKYMLFGTGLPSWHFASRQNQKQSSSAKDTPNVTPDRSRQKPADTDLVTGGTDGFDDLRNSTSGSGSTGQRDNQDVSEDKPVLSDDSPRSEAATNNRHSSTDDGSASTSTRLGRPLGKDDDPEDSKNPPMASVSMTVLQVDALSPIAPSSGGRSGVKWLNRPVPEPRPKTHNVGQRPATGPARGSWLPGQRTKTWRQRSSTRRRIYPSWSRRFAPTRLMLGNLGWTVYVPSVGTKLKNTDIAWA